MANRVEDDRRAPVIARGCAALSGALAIFWVIQLVRARAPVDIFVGASVFYFAIIALCFVFFERGKNIVVASWWPFLPVAARLIEERYGSRIVGVVSCASAVGFVVVMTVLQRRRRRVAQPGVEPDGPSARGLTP